jgi:hypothetical protein
VVFGNLIAIALIEPAPDALHKPALGKQREILTRQSLFGQVARAQNPGLARQIERDLQFGTWRSAMCLKT